MQKVTVAIGPDKGRVFNLKAGEPLVVGRRQCHLPLTDHNVSRHHARFITDGDGWSVADDGSTNGTFVNGMRIREPTPLKAGDQIRIGRTVLIFHGKPATGRGRRQAPRRAAGPPASLEAYLRDGAGSKTLSRPAVKTPKSALRDPPPGPATDRAPRRDAARKSHKTKRGIAVARATQIERGDVQPAPDSDAQPTDESRVLASAIDAEPSTHVVPKDDDGPIEDDAAPAAPVTPPRDAARPRPESTPVQPSVNDGAAEPFDYYAWERREREARRRRMKVISITLVVTALVAIAVSNTALVWVKFSAEPPPVPAPAPPAATAGEVSEPPPPIPAPDDPETRQRNVQDIFSAVKQHLPADEPEQDQRPAE